MDPFAKDEKPVLKPKTFWLKGSTIEQLDQLLKLVKARGGDPDKVIALVKDAIDLVVRGMSQNEVIEIRIGKPGGSFEERVVNKGYD